VENSSGECILFLDSDDRITERHVEVALQVLRSAPPEVAFVYPDMQFYGNERNLVVMPPYNLYLLLHRNFCCMGGLIDRAVFEAGHQFRVDLLHGHEDWDFFIRLGVNGIFGAPFHGTPLLYRRWGFSRSDSVQEKGTFIREVRDLHPEFNDSERLIEIKREWCPALSVIVSQNSYRDPARQTCDDFELVPVPSDRKAPRARGRWVLVLDAEHTDLLGDPTFVERIIRLMSRQSSSKMLKLHRSAMPSPAWGRLSMGGGHSPIALVMDGTSYALWSQRVTLDLENFSRFFARVGGLLAGADSWSYWIDERRVLSAPKSEGRTLRPPPPIDEECAQEKNGEAESPWPATKLARQGSTFEQSFRHFECRPLFVPDGGFRRLPVPPASYRDELEAITQEAWSDWMPARSVRLDLVIDATGRTKLESLDRRAIAKTSFGVGRARHQIGWIWSQPFPGTVALFEQFDDKTHQVSYRVADNDDLAEGDVALGYIATQPLPGRVILQRSLEELGWALNREDLVTLPTIQGHVDNLYVEVATSGGMSPLAKEDRSRVSLQRWPLYEIPLRSGAYRYTRDPDACVGRNDVTRSYPTQVAEIIDPGSIGSSSSIYEARHTPSGSIGYISELELVAGNGIMEPVAVIGAVQARTSDAMPLVRLRAPDLVPPPYSLGHRLAIAWQSLTSESYVPEGVIGYCWKPNPHRLPLYRWWDVAHGSWHLSLGDDAARQIPFLMFEGTLGTAWSPSVLNEGYVDLWEMELRGSYAYTTDPVEFEKQGYFARRLVARLLKKQLPGSLPLLTMSSADGHHSLVTTCQAEGELAGLTNRGVLGYVEIGVPNHYRMAAAMHRDPPAWAAPVDMSDFSGHAFSGYLLRDPVQDGIEVWGSDGTYEDLRMGSPGNDAGKRSLLGYALPRLAPFTHPVYIVPGEVPGSELMVTEVSVHGSDMIRGIAGYLPGPDYMEPRPKREGERGVRTALKSFATGSLVGKLNLTKVIPGSLRQRFRQFVR
jgi:hypothetical protein